jgi:hypothetical protein
MWGFYNSVIKAFLELSNYQRFNKYHDNEVNSYYVAELLVPVRVSNLASEKYGKNWSSNGDSLVVKTPGTTLTHRTLLIDFVESGCT